MCSVSQRLREADAHREILQAIEDNGGKISRKKLHEVTDMTYKTLDSIIGELEKDSDILFVGHKGGKLRGNKRWKMAEITRKGEGKLGQ